MISVFSETELQVYKIPCVLEKGGMAVDHLWVAAPSKAKAVSLGRTALLIEQYATEYLC